MFTTLKINIHEQNELKMFSYNPATSHNALGRSIYLFAASKGYSDFEE